MDVGIETEVKHFIPSFKQVRTDIFLEKQIYTFFFFLYIVTEEDQNVNEEILRWREELIFHVTHSNVVFSWENQVLLEMEINGNWGPCQAEKLQLLVCTSAVSPG